MDSHATHVQPAATDEQLMLAHQQGTADAFPELFARYRQIGRAHV